MREGYTFLSIRDAVSAINQKGNLMGVVVEYGIPKRSKGTDCFCTIKITDESYQGHSLVVNIFAENMEKMPHIKSAGDIICLSRVVMKAHQGEINALFNKLSSFALFDGKSGSNFIPYQTSSNFCIRDSDKEFMTSLRMWLLDVQLNSGENESLSLLREIKDGHYFNFVCKILHVCQISEDKWMLFLWDGTDAPPLSCHTRLNDEMRNPLPLQLEPMPLSRDILSTFPHVGTVLRVFIEKASEKLGLHLPGSGRWVKLLNIMCKVHMGLWYGVSEPSTKLRILSNEDYIVINHERVYEKRLFSKQGRMPFSAFPWVSRITETDFDKAPFVTLMDVLCYSQVTAKFKCAIRVVAMCPWKVENFRAPVGNRFYMVKLTIEDPTARIHAFIYAEDGEKFFDGYPTMDVLTNKRNKLLGITEGDDGKENENVPRNPPWVQCCLKSYYIDKNDPWTSRNYRIFGTRLVA